MPTFRAVSNRQKEYDRGTKAEQHLAAPPPAGHSAGAFKKQAHRHNSSLGGAKPFFGSDLCHDSYLRQLASAQAALLSARAKLSRKKDAEVLGDGASSAQARPHLLSMGAADALPLSHRSYHRCPNALCYPNIPRMAPIPTPSERCPPCIRLRCPNDSNPESRYCSVQCAANGPCIRPRCPNYSNPRSVFCSAQCATDGLGKT